MATLSQTAFKAPRDNQSTHKLQYLVYTGNAAYVAGGDSFLPSDLGWGSIDAVEVCGVAHNGTASAAPTAVRLVTYDHAAQKLVWVVPNTGSEASGDLSAYAVRLIVHGHG